METRLPITSHILNGECNGWNFGDHHSKLSIQGEPFDLFKVICFTKLWFLSRQLLRQVRILCHECQSREAHRNQSEVQSEGACEGSDDEDNGRRERKFGSR